MAKPAKSRLQPDHAAQSVAESARATIFDIQRFSVHDGPGIRTTVFFKGCNLRCFWCHNPESISPEPEIQYLPFKCIGCGRCLTVCLPGCHQIDEDGRHVFDRSECTLCHDCVENCPSEALSLVGRDYTVQEVLDVVLRDQPFYKESGGGMTCSGGEPMLQSDFLRHLLAEAKAAGLHTAVDTAGNVPFQRLTDVMPYTDLFLYDVKCMDPVRHRQVTGVGNERILDNLVRLDQAGAKIWVRIPIIPSVNDNLENILSTVDLLKGMKHLERVELLTYHRLGGGKYESLGKTYKALDIQPPTRETMKQLAQPFADAGLNVKIS